MFDQMQHAFEVHKDQCLDEPFIDLLATNLVRKYSNTTYCTGKTPLIWYAPVSPDVAIL